MKKILVTANLDYVSGYLRYGHVELGFDREEWESLTTEEQIEMLESEGEVVIDDFSLEDRGAIVSINVEEIDKNNKEEEL